MLANSLRTNVESYGALENVPKPRQAAMLLSPDRHPSFACLGAPESTRTKPVKAGKAAALRRFQMISECFRPSPRTF